MKLNVFCFYVIGTTQLSFAEITSQRVLLTLTDRWLESVAYLCLDCCKTNKRHRCSYRLHW